jgi:hypothetical protein
MFISQQIVKTLKPVKMPTTIGISGISTSKGLFSNIGKLKVLSVCLSVQTLYRSEHCGDIYRGYM